MTKAERVAKLKKIASDVNEQLRQMGVIEKTGELTDNPEILKQAFRIWGRKAPPPQVKKTLAEKFVQLLSKHPKATLYAGVPGLLAAGGGLGALAHRYFTRPTPEEAAYYDLLTSLYY